MIHSNTEKACIQITPKFLFKRHFFEHMDTPNDSCYEVALLIVA